MATSTTLSLALHHVSENYGGGDSYTGTIIKQRAQQQSGNAGGASLDNTTNTLSSLPRSPTGGQQSYHYPPSASPPPHGHQPQQSVKHGVGRYDFADGSFYEGEWSHGSMNGKGVYFEASTGDKFDGIWKEGRRVQGVYRYGENGNMYIGGFDLETGSKKTGPALVLDQCVLYKALYAEDRLIKRDMVLMPAHKDWTTFAGGLTAAHHNNPNKYTDPDHSLIYRKHPSFSSSSAAVKRTASSSSNAALLSPRGERSPQRNQTTQSSANAVTSQAAATPNSVTTPSPAAYRRAMSPTAYSRTATAMSSFNGSSPTPRPHVHSSGANYYHHQGSVRTNRSPSPTTAGGRVSSVIGGTGSASTPQKEKATIVKASYRAPHVVITSSNRADASGLGRVSVLAAAADKSSASGVSIAESQKTSIDINGLHGPTVALYGGVGSSNRMRQVISQNSGRNFGAGPVTVGVAPRLKTTERCASPSRQEAFASLCEAVKSQPRHDDLNASIVPGGVSSGQYSNNTYYEDVTLPDHPLGMKLMTTVHAEGERDGGRGEEEDTMDPMLFADVSVSRNTSIEPSAGYSSRRKEGEEGEERGSSAKASRETAGEGGPSYFEGVRADREGEDVTVSSEEDDDEEIGHKAVGKFSKNSKENDDAGGRHDAAATLHLTTTTTSMSGDTRTLTPQEALATAKAVLRQRRSQIEEDQLVNKKLSTMHNNESSSSAVASFRREQSSSSQQQQQQQQQRLHNGSIAGEDRNYGNPHPRTHTAASLLDTTPTGYGSSLYNNIQPQGGAAVTGSTMAAYHSPMPSRGAGNGAVALVDHNSSPAPLLSGSGGGSGALLMVPPARTKNGAVILPPPNPRSSTCRSLSNSAFGNIQRGRVEHVDDVSKIELEQAYRYFNYNKGA